LAFRDWLVDGGRGRKTVDNNLTALRAFFSWCVELKKMRNNPIRESRVGVKLFFNDDTKRRRAFTTGEYATIIAEADPDMSMRLRFLGITGLRIGELAALEWSDFDLQNGWLHIRAKMTCDGFSWSPKDGTDRKLPIEGELAGLLRELNTAFSGRNGYVFPGQEGHNRVKNFSRTTLKRLKALHKPTGIAETDLLLHNFRHFFVSQCADCGIDMACVMDWVGHDDLAMVLRYYGLRDDHARNAMRRFTTAADPGHQS
jgi:integrase